MVVGSLDDWLTSTRRSCLRDNDVHCPAAVLEFPDCAVDRVAGVGSTSRPSATHEGSTASAARVLANAPATRLSLLTRELRTSLAADVGTNPATECFGSEGCKSPCRLDRSHSQPELEQGARTVIPERDILSSPLHYQCSRPQCGGIGSVPGREEGRPLGVQRPGASTDPFGLAADADGRGWVLDGDAEGAGICRTSWHECAPTPTSASTSALTTVHEAAVRVVAPPSELGGTRTSQRLNLYDGTVRGGQPRRAAVLQRRGLTALTRLPQSAALELPSQSPDSQPRLLGEMLQRALLRV